MDRGHRNNRINGKGNRKPSERLAKTMVPEFKENPLKGAIAFWG